MRNLSIIFLLCLLLAGTHAHAQINVQAKPQQAEVQRTVIRIFDGLSALDTAAIDKYVTRDFMILENGVVWNMDTIAAKLAPLKKSASTGSIIWILSTRKSSEIRPGWPEKH